MSTSTCCQSPPKPPKKSICCQSCSCPCRLTTPKPGPPCCCTSGASMSSTTTPPPCACGGEGGKKKKKGIPCCCNTGGVDIETTGRWSFILSLHKTGLPIGMLMCVCHINKFVLKTRHKSFINMSLHGQFRVDEFHPIPNEPCRCGEGAPSPPINEVKIVQLGAKFEKGTETPTNNAWSKEPCSCNKSLPPVRVPSPRDREWWNRNGHYVAAFVILGLMCYEKDAVIKVANVVVASLISSMSDNTNKQEQPSPAPAEGFSTADKPAALRTPDQTRPC